MARNMKEIRVKIRNNNNAINQMWCNGSFGRLRRKTSLLWCCNFNMQIRAVHAWQHVKINMRYDFSCVSMLELFSPIYISKLLKLKLFRNALLIFFLLSGFSGCYESPVKFCLRLKISSPSHHIRLYRFKWYLSCYKYFISLCEVNLDFVLKVVASLAHRGVVPQGR